MVRRLNIIATTLSCFDSVDIDALPQKRCARSALFWMNSVAPSTIWAWIKSVQGWPGSALASQSLTSATPYVLFTEVSYPRILYDGTNSRTG
jgi:hypothetical protein